MDLNNILLASNLCDKNNFQLINNLEYIYFKYHQCIKLYFNTHFISFNDNTYFIDHFKNNNIEDIILNSNSEDIINFKNIIINTTYKQLTFNKAIIIWFHTKSMGHEMAMIIYLIYLYFINNWVDYDIIISDDILNYGIFINSILPLFIDKSKIHYVDNLTKVIINETIIYYPPHYFEDNALNFLITKLETLKNNKSLENNICLIKTINNKLIYNTPLKSFNEDYNIYFNKKYNFIIIEPTNYEIIDLYNIVNNSKNIIMSWGCNSWINKIFVNKNSNFICLCHIGYKNEYINYEGKENNNIKTLITPICKNLIMIYDLNINLDIETQKIIDEKLLNIF